MGAALPAQWEMYKGSRVWMTPLEPHRCASVTLRPLTSLRLRIVASPFTVSTTIMPLTESWARETLVKSLETGGVPAVFAHTADDSVWTVVSPSSKALPISGKYDVSVC
jgi:hypothetical protein